MAMSLSLASLALPPVLQSLPAAAGKSSDQYRSSSSSAGSPSAVLAAGRPYYFPRPGRPVSFEDFPDWGDDIAATAAHDSSASSIHLASLASSAYPSPSLPEHSAAPTFTERKVAGGALVWKELSVSVRGGSGRHCSQHAMEVCRIPRT